MKRILSITVLLLLACTFIFAQEETLPQDNSVAIDESNESEVTFDFHVLKKGDTLLNLNLALSLPIRPTPQLKIGGELSIGFAYMLTDMISVGSEASFSYNSTIGNNILYFIPILATVGFHPTIGNFEISAKLSLGGAFENYLDRSYFGLTIKPEVGVYYKFFADWLIGVSGGLFILPQWYRDSSKNYTSLITDIKIGAKYLF
ncbi:MAG: hypothetical protein K5751_11220 [Treponemataceae bacterium]|nr:hypothetical protein [Treponemataceae bacterium]